ncbi:MAG TPA: DUF309 domain-containing protein [Synechococcus sp. UBA8638]|uniref:DUF309 domain-containing protein n=1 Tax=Candidatus Synechococcus spongiarum TaxID=431041 RepID=UPI00046EA757|nr:DUF309 domain-containing protein [Candidatus Synechococcus spongiarum]HBP54147.1 DUF309 domain-containing protein [Synechococcus sp. UBA8638]
MGACPDPALAAALILFAREDWYACHDALEALWQESLEPRRTPLQALVQIAVAMVHWGQGNRRGATLLWGEAVARLARCRDELDELDGVDLAYLHDQGRHWLRFLQTSPGGTAPPPPRLSPPGGRIEDNLNVRPAPPEPRHRCPPA